MAFAVAGEQMRADPLQPVEHREGVGRERNHVRALRPCSGRRAGATRPRRSRSTPCRRLRRDAVRSRARSGRRPAATARRGRSRATGGQLRHRCSVRSRSHPLRHRSEIGDRRRRHRLVRRPRATSAGSTCRRCSTPCAPSPPAPGPPIFRPVSGLMRGSSIFSIRSRDFLPGDRPQRPIHPGRERPAQSRFHHAPRRRAHVLGIAKVLPTELLEGRATVPACASEAPQALPSPGRGSFPSASLASASAASARALRDANRGVVAERQLRRLAFDAESHRPRHGATRLHHQPQSVVSGYSVRAAGGTIFAMLAGVSFIHLSPVGVTAPGNKTPVSPQPRQM